MMAEISGEQLSKLPPELTFDQYELRAWANYEDFAETIATILTATIRRVPQLRLQQVNFRAKAPVSLKKKLKDRGIVDTQNLAENIKDLAGCRVIFYTNSDVLAFVQSGLMYENFEVIEVKIHHPQRNTEHATELFISDNYLVSLKSERMMLAEYARFAGMRCEIQVQTILNHAWAEMAHDTIYKKPRLGGFGDKAFEAIERRLDKVMREHLLPAGYDFQKIANDFDRLLTGKELFDQQPLQAIIDAADNNERFEAIERLTEHVLPLYDKVETEYPEIVEALLQAVERARQVTSIPIETPFGALPGEGVEEIADLVVKILERYRYVNVVMTLKAVVRLYPGAGTEKERAILIELGEKLAKHELAVWKNYGPAVQAMLLDEIENIPAELCRNIRPLLIPMLGEILKSEVEGVTSNSYESITIHQGAVAASDILRTVRRRAIALLRGMLDSAVTDHERHLIIAALSNATDLPHSVVYGNELALLTAEDAQVIIGIYRDLIPTLSLELLQSIEGQMLNLHFRYRADPKYVVNDATLSAARAAILPQILLLRDEINGNPEFVTYKTLVGYESVFPGAWDGNPFDDEARQAWRDARISAMVEEITEENAATWLVTISRCAQTESNDLATFPSFAGFLRNLAEVKPTVILGYLHSLDPRLAQFLPAMLCGLVRGGSRAPALSEIEQWIGAGKYLGIIADFLGSTIDFEESLLERLLRRAIELDDNDAVLAALMATVGQYEKRAGTLIEKIFLPAVNHLVAKGDMRWATRFWRRNSALLLGLDEHGVQVILDTLVTQEKIERNVEEILSTFAKKWPARVIFYLGKRMQREFAVKSASKYRAVPFSIHRLVAPLAVVPGQMVKAAREWFDLDKRLFSFRGGRLLAEIYPDFPPAFQDELASMTREGDRDNISFVLAILQNYEGSEVIHDLCKNIIDRLVDDEELLSDVASTIRATGAVLGEFGLVEKYENIKAQISAWQDDPRPKVRVFAQNFARSLDKAITAEQRQVEGSIAIRRRDWGDDS